MYDSVEYIYDSIEHSSANQLYCHSYTGERDNTEKNMKTKILYPDSSNPLDLNPDLVGHLISDLIQ